MKKLFALLMMSVMIFSSFAVVSADEVSGQQTQIISLSLEDALKKVETDNPELKLMDMKIAIADTEYWQSLDDADAAKDKFSKTIEDKIANEKVKQIDWQRKLITLNNLKYDRNEKLKSLKLDITKQYMSLQLSQKDIENSQIDLTNLDTKINDMLLKVKLGLVREIDVKSLQAQRLTMQSQIDKSKGQLEIDMLSFKNALGIDTKTNLYLFPVQKEYATFNDYDIANRIAAALAKSHDVENAQKDYDLTVLEKDITAKYYDYVPSTVKDLETTVVDKASTLDNTKRSVEASLWTAYYNLKSLEDSVEIARLNVAIDELNLQITQAKVKAGQATAATESNDKLTLEKQKASFQKAINDYMITIDEFVNQLGE